VLRELNKKTQHAQITRNDITERIDFLDILIPTKYGKEKEDICTDIARKLAKESSLFMEDEE
jgi:hypothetical protein